MFLAAASYCSPKRPRNKEQACLQDSAIEGSHNRINHESIYETAKKGNTWATSLAQEAVPLLLAGSQEPKRPRDAKPGALIKPRELRPDTQTRRGGPTMPRGGKKGHKGRGKQFSNPEEIDRQMRAQREREENGDAECKSSSESEEESSSEDEQNQKRSGVEGLIEIENPNRVSQKNKKIAEMDVSEPKELSRRERQEIERQKAKERYMKLHLEGKTEQARADLARLAIIKKQREEAAKKREEMRKEKDAQEAKSKR
ncbi:hypothetical protein AOLI_G00129670 [Acnodon oligacanthus]